MSMVKLNEIQVSFSCRMQTDFNNGLAVPDFLTPDYQLRPRNGWELAEEHEILAVGRSIRISYSSYTKDDLAVYLVINEEDDEVYFFANNLLDLQTFVNDYNFNTVIVADGTVMQYG